MKKHSLSLALALSAAATLFSNVSSAQSDVPCPADNASYNTGVYYNAFLAAGLGTQAQIDTKVNANWSQFFSDSDANRLLYAADSSKSYIKAIDSNDIRSEGMSYGMMIAVQMDQQAVFDKLWNFAITYELRKEGSVNDHFAWQLNTTDYKAIDNGPASDGEIYFAMSLILAHNRWGSGNFSATDTNYKNYKYWATEVIRMLEAKFFKPFNTLPFRDGSLVRFVPGADFTDASYHLPVFFEMFAIWKGQTAKTDFWRKAANVARNYLVDATSQHESGLTSDYGKWDGTRQPMAGTGTTNDNADKFAYDSWRVIHNAAMDVAFCTMDSHGRQAPWQQLNWWKSKGGTWDSSTKKWSSPYYDRYNFATSMFIGTDHSAGHIAMNGSGAALFYGDTPTANTLTKPFLEELWNQAAPKDNWRYYGGLLHTFGVLRAAGRYKLWKPGALPFKVSAQTLDSDPLSLKAAQPRITVTNSTTDALTNFKAKYFFTTVEGRTPVLTDVSTPNSNPTLEQLDTRTWQVVLDYSGKTLAPGASLPATGNGETFRLTYSDNSDFDKADDYSYPYSGSTATATTRVAVYNGAGTLVMGATPPGRLPSYPAVVKNSFGNMVLTATGPGNDLETRAQPLTAAWNTQTWVVEPVQDTGYVRLKNASNNRYLNVQNDGENAKAVAYDINLNWRSELWVVEPADGGGVRLRNAWANRYLTVVDSGSYSQVLSKALVTSWPSQVWSIQ